MKSKVRVGIVGAGRNTRDKHVPGLRALANVEISGVCNRSRESSERAARELGIPKTYGHWRQLVEDPDITAVVIGTWPYLHCPVTLAALEAGKHVLCEARMAMNAAEAREMLAAHRRHPELVCQIVPSPMTLAVDRTIIRLLTAGELGDLVAVELVVRSGEFPDPASAMTWRQNEDLSGHNVMSLGIWLEALMRWLGPPKSVGALGRTMVPLRRDADRENSVRFTRIPDHLYVLCELAGDVPASLSFSTVAGGEPAAHVSLYGSRASLSYHDGLLELRRNGEQAAAQVSVPEGERGGWQVEGDFVRSIVDGAPVGPTSFEDGARYMEVTEAVWRSMEEGRRVAVPV